jgi:uncharacterized membrane protein
MKMNRAAIMIAMRSSAAKTNASLAVSIFGWSVIAVAIRTPGQGLEILNLGAFLIGLGLLVGGLFMMLLAER